MDVTVLTSCFRGIDYLPEFLESVAAQTIFDETEIVLSHNEPNSNELQNVRDFQALYPGQLRHIIVNPVEPLGASWNRCWYSARGRYVCIWNTDDLRTPDSLQRQRDVLDHQPDAALAYGDFMIVRRFGDARGRYVSTPDFDRLEFSRSFPVGPFPMWRREIGAQVGYFDEQLRSGADFDLSVRIALRFPMVRVPNLLGYFTNEGTGLSTGNVLQPTERTVIELRYGIYDKIDYDYLPRALRYNIPSLLQFGQWVPVEQLVPEYEKFISDRHNRWFALGLNDHFHRRGLQPSLVARANRRISLIFNIARKRIFG